MSKKVRILSYVVTTDSGFAPNPFWGFCTLAACTPNHMGARIVSGDWIVGWSNKATGNKLIYAMKVNETLGFNAYYHDLRFQKKIPNLEGNLKERCGDNIYYWKNNEWKKTASVGHSDESFIKRDTKYPRVFISSSFYYFGRKAVEVPDVFHDLIQRRQGFKYHQNEIASAFLLWLRDNFDMGCLGTPRDWKSSCKNENETSTFNIKCGRQ